MRARSRAKEKRASLKIILNGKELGSIDNLVSSDFQWYCFEMKKKAIRIIPKIAKGNELNIFILNELLEIDKIILSATPYLSKVRNH